MSRATGATESLQVELLGTGIDDRPSMRPRRQSHRETHCSVKPSAFAQTFLQ
jgi:hypothetical protein